VPARFAEVLVDAGCPSDETKPTWVVSPDLVTRAGSIVAAGSRSCRRSPVPADRPLSDNPTTAGHLVGPSSHESVVGVRTEPIDRRGPATVSLAAATACRGLRARARAAASVCRVRHRNPTPDPTAPGASEPALSFCSSSPRCHRWRGHRLVRLCITPRVGIAGSGAMAVLNPAVSRRHESHVPLIASDPVATRPPARAVV